MPTTSTENHVLSDCDGATVDSPRPRGRERSTRHVGGIAAYYRLRSIVLEARIVALENELERKDRQLQQTITRYEEILQRRPEQGAVSIGEASDPPDAETDG